MYELIYASTWKEYITLLSSCGEQHSNMPGLLTLWRASTVVCMQVIEDNAKALVSGGKMPYAKSAGKTSTPDNASGTALKQTMPRDHA